MRRKIPMIISVMVLLVSVVPTFVVAKSFNDVAESHWAYTYINELSDANVISGYSNNNFNPSNTITKAEYLKLLVSTVATEKENNNLTEAMKGAAQWYEPYLEFAKSNEIIEENYTNEQLGETVSRKEMASLLVEFADYVDLTPVHDGSFNTAIDYEITLGNEDKELTDAEVIKAYGLTGEVTVVDDLTELVKDLELAEVEGGSEGEALAEAESTFEETLIADLGASFTDINALTEKEQSDIEYAVELGLVNGYNDGTFKPENAMTRAEVATIIYRLMNSFDKIEVEEVEGPVLVEAGE